MSARCEVCGKGPGFGNAVRRLGKNAQVRKVKSRTNRRFDPNIQRVRALVNGTPTRVRVCTGCLKSNKIVRPHQAS